MIWLAFLVPLCAIAFAAINYSKNMNVLEYVLLLIVPAICIGVGKWGSVYTQTKDTEYWNTYAVHALYEEEWKEQWEESHTETTTDSDGNTHSRTYWTTETKRHPEEWILFDDLGKPYPISSQYFEELCKLWSNRNFKEMDRKHTSSKRSESSHKILKDGDAYVTKYDNKFEHTVPICTSHTYKNKIQCSKSIFNFDKVNPETVSQYGLFEYPPEDIHNFNPILGYQSKPATQLLRAYNAHNGARKQLHMMLLVFKDQPLEAAFFQESYWKGGNKNEFLVCVGLSGTNLTWTKVISWTEQETLKIRVAREIKEMKSFDAVQVVRYMGENIPKEFIRKEFADFSYLSVEPTVTAIMITLLITTITTIGIMIYSISNSYDFGSFIHRNRYRNRW